VNAERLDEDAELEVSLICGTLKGPTIPLQSTKSKEAEKEIFLLSFTSQPARDV